MIIQTTIRTPQFKDGKVFDYTVQSGKLSTVHWLFEPERHISGTVGMHNVHFHYEENYLKSKIE